MSYGYRSDSSDYLYHWIKNRVRLYGEDPYEDAFETMSSIIENQFIYSGKEQNKNNNPCISFTESVKSEIIHDKSRYQPFGFEFKKVRIHELGGRTAIYSTSEEKKELGVKHQWRHVKFDLSDTSKGKSKGHDFTWEREWRLNCSSLSLFECTGIYVPNEHYLEKLHKLLDGMYSMSAYENSVYFGVLYPSQDVGELCNFMEGKTQIV